MAVTTPEDGQNKLEGKVFVLGDENCGKSTLIEELTGRGHNNNNPVKTGAKKCNEIDVMYEMQKKRRKRRCCCACCCFKRRKPKLESETKPMTLTFTLCKEDEPRMRAVNYLDADVLLLCFDVSSEQSFINLKDKWLPEAQKYSPPEVPLLIACLKADERKKESSIKRKTSKLLRISRPLMLPAVQGEELAKSAHAYAYIECSVKNKEGLENLKEKITNALTMT